MNDTQPLWFFSSVAGDCTSGMVLSVNPPVTGDQTAAAFKAAAMASTPSTSQPSSSSSISSSQSQQSTESASATSSSDQPSDTNTNAAARGYGRSPAALIAIVYAAMMAQV